MKQKYCDCPSCPCNVPTDGQRDCLDCRRGNHMDWKGVRRDEANPVNVEMDGLGPELAPRLEGL